MCLVVGVMMTKPNRLYDLLLDYCSRDMLIDTVLIGAVWTICQTRDKGATGLAMSPAITTRMLPWSGTLSGKPVTELAAWITHWEPYQATVAMAAINCCINSRPLPESVPVASSTEHANLAVFEYFLPHLRNKKVVVIGHYPGIERYQHAMQLTVLEKHPNVGDLPDAACEFLLPTADWVFLTASSITNKTFPRLAELARHAKTVLMGPTVPWLPQLHEFGIDYLAGIDVIDATALYHTVAQGGGVRIFENSLRYRIAELSPTTSMAWLKQQIADCVAEKMRLTSAMENWYRTGSTCRFPDCPLLEQLNARLSRLDSSFARLWNAQNT